jgi:hypothetical protein
VALRTGFASCPCCGGRLHLAEGSEENVGEGSVHRLRHDDGEDEAGRSVERAGDDQQLVLSTKPMAAAEKSGVGVQQRDDRRHVGAADGNDEQHSEDQRDADDDWEEYFCFGMQYEVARTTDREQRQKVDEVLSFISNRALRQDFLQFAGGHQTAGEGQPPRMTSIDSTDNPNFELFCVPR